MKKHKFSRFLSIFGLSLLMSTSAWSQNALQAGDMVAICGDSITSQKQYSVFIEDYLLMCQPQTKLQAMQFGWGGETSKGLLGRMKNDVLPFNPTVATTCYGMNDGGYAALDPKRLAEYKTATTEIVKTFKAAGVRFIVVGSPGAVDSTTFKRSISPEVYNQTLASLGAAGKQIAAEQGVAFADVHTPMLEAMQKAKAKYGDKYPVAGSDGVHPHPNGHLVMAFAFLKALGCNGEIGTLTFDAQRGMATGSDGHQIVSSAPSGFKVESSRYPFCFYGEPRSPTGTRSMVDLLPFNQELNRFLLVVKNSQATRLKVTWGTVSKEFPRAKLEQGINLAAEFLDNPFSQPFTQGEDVIKAQQMFETLAIKSLLHNLPDGALALPEDQPTFDRLKASILKRSQAQRAASSAAVTPVTHEFKIEALP
jgi:lysophospholipase L1-like esterase